MRLSRFALTRIPRWNPCQGCLLVVNGPTIRPFSAMSAAKEDRARRASHAKFMASREVAVQPVPHVSLCSEVRDLFYRKAGAARGDDAANTRSRIFTNKMRWNSRRRSCAGVWDMLSHDQIWDSRLRLSYRWLRKIDICGTTVVRPKEYLDTWPAKSTSAIASSGWFQNHRVEAGERRCSRSSTQEASRTNSASSRSARHEAWPTIAPLENSSTGSGINPSSACRSRGTPLASL